MPKINLTDTGLRSLEVPNHGQTDWWDASFKAGLFGCRVSQGGTKTFQIKHQNRRITIGQFPTISLAEARQEAKRLLAEFTLGKVRPQSITYQNALALFLEEKGKGRKPRTVADYKRLLTRFNFKGQLTELSHEELQRRLKRFTAEGEYNHLLVALKVFLNWCIKRRYIEHNPTIGLSTHSRPTRARILSDKELQLIWRACEQTGGCRGDVLSETTPTRLPANFATIVKLLILTGQRRGEIAALQTSWIKDNQITLPATITKNGREHTFPIGSLTFSLLTERLTNNTQTLLFPSRLKSTCFNGWSKSKANLDKLSGVYDWTLHDLRRTFATRMAELGVAPHVIERLLNHITGQISGVAAVYNRASYLPEMRQAIQKWEDKLKSLVG